MPILQTPFGENGAPDFESMTRLVEFGIAGGISGAVFPAVASEVDFLSNDERRGLLKHMVTTVGGRIPIIAGVSAADPEDSFALAEHARDAGAGAILVQPNETIRADRNRLVAFLSTLADRGGLPIVLQDLDWSGPGLAMVWIEFVLRRVEAVRGVKVETVPAGPKYSAIKAAFGDRVHVSGGWAVTQMIDGLDRGVDAFMPECSMVGIYRRIWDLHQSGDRDAALELFDRLAPVLLFSNQHIDISIQFFKWLLKARGICTTTRRRSDRLAFDEAQEKLAAELIDHVFAIECKFRID